MFFITFKREKVFVVEYSSIRDVKVFVSEYEGCAYLLIKKRL